MVEHAQTRNRVKCDTQDEYDNLEVKLDNLPEEEFEVAKDPVNLQFEVCRYYEDGEKVTIAESDFTWES